ncbi:hypothetical protein Ddc_10167 [Ditylenchus destructor]|nr:hypothetical protein Ddc_10167 [Ditylenchus destructor]
MRIIILILAIICHQRTFASDAEMSTDNGVIFTKEFIEKEILGRTEPDQKLETTINILSGVMKEIADLMPEIKTCDGIVTIVRRKRRDGEARMKYESSQEEKEELKEAINETAKKVAIALTRKGKTFHPHMAAHIWKQFVCHGWSSHHRLVSIAEFSNNVKMAMEGLRSS